jgi:hypothetical protein
MIAARIHALSQEAFWKYVLNGRDKPVGKLTDFWRRVEFQSRGSPHSHSLGCVLRFKDNDGKVIMTDVVVNDDKDIQKKAVEYLQNIATARLADRHPEDDSDIGVGPEADVKRKKERTYNFEIKRSEYFRDGIDVESSYCHPCRTRMPRPKVSADEVVDYTYRNVNGAVAGRKNTVAVIARRLQLANQMHCCQQSCYKYCKKGKGEQVSHNVNVFRKHVFQKNIK